MPASKSAVVEPSNTTRVFEALERADDFLSTAQVVAASGVPVKSAMTALHYLATVHAVESVHSGVRLHWFATPHLDQRTRTIPEHRKEDEPRAASPLRRGRKPKHP